MRIDFTNACLLACYAWLLNRHPFADACSMLSSTLLSPLPGCFPSAIGPSTTPPLDNQRATSHRTQFHRKTLWRCTGLVSLVGQPLDRGPKADARACSHVLCSRLRLLRPLTCGDMTACCYITVTGPVVVCPGWTGPTASLLGRGGLFRGYNF
jgi:hypothetical protein